MIMHSTRASGLDMNDRKQNAMCAQSMDFYHLDLGDESVYVDVHVDERPKPVRFYGVDYSMQCMDLLLHMCSALRLNVGDYLIIVPAESLTGDKTFSWRCAPPSSKLSDWMDIPNNSRSRSLSIPDYLRLVPKGRVRRFAKFDNCFTYQDSTRDVPKAVVKSGTEVLKDLGQRIVIHLPHSRKLVVRSQLDVPIMNVIEKVSRERNLNLKLLCLTNVRTGKLLDPSKTFEEYNITKIELKECEPGQSNIHSPDGTIKVRQPNTLPKSSRPTSICLQSYKQSSVPVNSPIDWSRSTISSMISVRDNSEKLSIFDGVEVNSGYRILTPTGTITRNYKKRTAPCPPSQDQIELKPVNCTNTMNSVPIEKIIHPKLPATLRISSVNTNDSQNTMSNTHSQTLPLVKTNEVEASTQSGDTPDHFVLVTKPIQPETYVEADTVITKLQPLHNKSEPILWNFKQTLSCDNVPIPDNNLDQRQRLGSDCIKNGGESMESPSELTKPIDQIIAQSYPTTGRSPDFHDHKDPESTNNSMKTEQSSSAQPTMPGPPQLPKMMSNMHSQEIPSTRAFMTELTAVLTRFRSKIDQSNSDAPACNNSIYYKSPDDAATVLCHTKDL